MSALALLLTALLAASCAHGQDAAVNGSAAVQGGASASAGAPCSGPDCTSCAGGEGGPLSCLVNPCDFARCVGHEGAYCEPNLCTCMPEWFVGSHEAVVCEEGRAGATEVSVPAGDCQLHKDPGTCEMHHLRYYFNNLRGRCEAFIWGGCGGNNNNFESVAECEEKCPAPSGSAVDSDGTQMPRRFGHQCGSKGHRCGAIFQCCQEFICCETAAGGSMCMPESLCPQKG